LAPQPVAFYAAVFFPVNATYILLIWKFIDRSPAGKTVGIYIELEKQADIPDLAAGRFTKCDFERQFT
jgi:hypothetical protein